MSSPVTVKMTELYDLKTTRDKIGILGVHTPDSITISKRWMGLFMNYKRFRVKSCNIRLACASLLPADPLQVSTQGPNAMAPQDIMNPILYRAMSNDVWNFFTGRLYSALGTNNRSIKYVDAFPSGSAAGAENVYYAMLGEAGWKKAMPQQGLQMKNLVPLVHEVVNTFGNIDMDYSDGTNLDSHPYAGATGTVAHDATVPQTLRGRSMRYPAIACTGPGAGNDAANPVFTPQSISKTMVACLVLPPGKLIEFYFRLVVDWYIEFYDVVSLVDKMSYPQIAGVGSLVYARNYTFESAKDLKEVDEDAQSTNTVDTIGADINLIMES